MRATTTLAVMLAFCGSACRARRAAEPPTPATDTRAANRDTANGDTASAPPGWRFAGCAAVTRGPRCALDDEHRALRLWVPGRASRCADTCSTDRGPVVCAARAGGHAEGDRHDHDRADADAGCAYEVTVPPGATRLCLERRQTSPDGEARGQATSSARTCLQITRRVHDPVLDAVARSRHEAPAAADAQLEALLAREREPDRRARAGALRARIALARGETARAHEGLRQAFAAAREAGRISDAAHDGFALAHLLITEALRFDEARAVLAAVAPLLEAFPEGRAEHAYYSGLLGAQTGDVRAALASLRRAIREADELGQSSIESYAETQLAVELAAVGRTTEALSLGEGVVRRRRARGRDPTEQPCNRAAPEVDLAWIALLAWRSGETWHADDARPDDARVEGVRDPGRLLAAARAALEREGCRDVTRWQNARLNEALFAVATGELATAHARLDELRDAAPPPSSYLAAWEAETRGRLALQEGRAREARAAFAREAELALAAGLIDGVLRAETGLGRVCLAEGQRAAATVHLRSARNAFEQLFARVPLGEGRDVFMQSHEESARFLIDALVRAGHAREAFTIARLERARALAAVAQARRLATLTPAERTRWEQALAAYRGARASLEAEALHDAELPRDVLVRARAARGVREQAARAHLDEAYALVRAGTVTASAALAWPRAHEVYLGYAPGDDVFWGFVATADGNVRARPIAGVGRRDLAPLAAQPAAERARRLLGPFGEVLREARRVSLFPHPALDELDLRALPLPDGTGHVPAQARPLGEARALDEGVDLPARPKEAPARESLFLVVTNPTEDLPATRAEGRDVARALMDASAARDLPRVVHLEGETATRARLLEALAQASFFHFAGHAFYAGTEGFESALPLAAASSLTVGDVLALPRVPGVATLAACEAAGAESGSRATLPLGVAEAFLAAGASVVLAPVRAVNDDLASAYMRALYQALAATEYWKDPAFSFAHAAGVADEVVRRTRPSAGASLFKVLAVPGR